MLSKNPLFSVRTVLISRGEPTQICYCIIAWEILEKKKRNLSATGQNHLAPKIPTRTQNESCAVVDFNTEE